MKGSLRESLKLLLAPRFSEAESFWKGKGEEREEVADVHVEEKEEEGSREDKGLGEGK